MRKEVIYLIFLILFSFQVLAIGMSPAKIEIDFQPNLRKSITFYAHHNEDYKTNLTFYVKGDLKKYVRLDKDSYYLEGKESVPIIAQLSLPSSWEKPGQSIIFVGVRDNPIEIPLGTITATVGVEAAIIINVPYPGKYAEIILEADNVDINETANFRIRFRNLGKERINYIQGELVVYDERDKEIAKIPVKHSGIEAGLETVIGANMKTDGLRAGPYKVIAILDYDGKKTTSETMFRIGDLIVELFNWSSVVKKGGIYPVDLWIRSLWNKDLQDVYADVIISRNNDVVSSLRSPSVNIGPYGEKRLNVYWDTGNKNGVYDMDVTLKYADKSNTKRTGIEVKGIEVNLNLILLILILVLIFIDVIWLIKRKKKKK